MKILDAEKTAQRAEIERAMAEFASRGGKIQQIEHYVYHDDPLAAIVGKAKADSLRLAAKRGKGARKK